jgi:glyoxylase-like metal-dependent hydrolase (beta-lactamase superfamily II)
LIVEQIPNNIFTSNSYKIKIGSEVWLVDIGSVEPVLSSIDANEIVRGVFLTHAHYYHIWVINELVGQYPNCKVYCSIDTNESLYNPKLNLSFYHESPIIYSGKNVILISDNDLILLANSNYLKVVYTPGHYKGCMSFILENYSFTGDSFIPNIPVVTKLKGGDKLQNIESLKKIRARINSETIICPGHGDIMYAVDI